MSLKRSSLTSRRQVMRRRTKRQPPAHPSRRREMLFIRMLPPLLYWQSISMLLAARPQKPAETRTARPRTKKTRTAT